MLLSRNWKLFALAGALAAAATACKHADLNSNSTGSPKTAATEFKPLPGPDRTIASETFAGPDGVLDHTRDYIGGGAKPRTIAVKSTVDHYEAVFNRIQKILSTPATKLRHAQKGSLILSEIDLMQADFVNQADQLNPKLRDFLQNKIAIARNHAYGLAHVIDGLDQSNAALMGVAYQEGAKHVMALNEMAADGKKTIGMIKATVL